MEKIMINKKETATRIERGLYIYKGWKITSRRVHGEGDYHRHGWLCVDIENPEEIFFDGTFHSLADAKDWIDEIQ